MTKENHHFTNPDPPPPIFGSWKKLYSIVLINLLVLIALFYLFTEAFE
jgi:hypothetical protein